MLTCCRCVELRRGCVAVGVFLMTLYAAAGLALTATAIYSESRGWREAVPLASGAPLALLCAVLHGVLVVGARRGRPAPLLAWLVGSGALFTAQSAALLVAAFLLAAGSLWAVLTSTAALTVLQALCWYWFWAVRRLYLELGTAATRRRLQTPAETYKDTDVKQQPQQQPPDV